MLCTMDHSQYSGVHLSEKVPGLRSHLSVPSLGPRPHVSFFQHAHSELGPAIVKIARW